MSNTLDAACAKLRPLPYRYQFIFFGTRGLLHCHLRALQPDWIKWHRVFRMCAGLTL
jgi:hypothetical protein